MDNLFFLLALFSLLALMIGLVKPSLFTKAIKGQATRKGVAKIFGSAFVVFFVLFAVNIDTAIPFQEIRHAYENDKQAAVAEYGGKMLEIKGKVIEVTADADSASNVVIGESRDESSYSYLRCMLETTDSRANTEAISKAATLKQGETVVVKGKMDSGLASIVMRECAVAD